MTSCFNEKINIKHLMTCSSDAHVLLTPEPVAAPPAPPSGHLNVSSTLIYDQIPAELQFVLTVALQEKLLEASTST